MSAHIAAELPAAGNHTLTRNSRPAFRVARVEKYRLYVSPMYLLLLLLSLSYWYCLPLITQGFIRYSEFRGYDVLLLVMGSVLILRYGQQTRTFFRNDPAGKWLLRFTIWATATFPVTLAMAIFNEKSYWALVTLVFLFHLWGFVLAYAAFRMFAQTRGQCFLILDLFLLAGTVQAVIICLQGLGIVPFLWSELYAVYGKALSGTLGPNRTMPGHAMILVLAVAFAYGRNMTTVGVKRLCLAIIATLTSLTALGMSSSRTAWLVFAVFILTTLIARRPQLSVLVFIVLVTATFVAVLPDAAANRIAEIYHWRVGTKLDRTPEDSDALATLEGLDRRRVSLWKDGAIALAEKPWFLPFGGGFNNYYYALDAGPSAHNLYITAVGEVGLIGLYFYLRWLLGIWRESDRLSRIARYVRKRGARVFWPFEMQTLLVGIIVSLCMGEILYPYRPAFTFMGMFLLVLSMLNSPVLVCGDEHAHLAQNQIKRPRRAQFGSLRNRKAIAS